MKHSFFLYLSFLFISLPAFSQDSRSGLTSAPELLGNYSIQAVRVENCKNDLAACEQKAKAGDLNAMYGVASEEIMTPYKTQSGLKKLRYAAEKGNIDAQALLGMILLGWDNVPSNPKQARYWWTKAAANGHVEANKNIGKMYYYGDGGEQNYKKAAEIFQSNQQAQNPESQYYLGLLYLKGQSVEQDQEKGIMLIQNSAYKNVIAAQRSYGEILAVAGKVDEGYIWLGQAALQKDRKALERIMILEKTIIKDAKKIKQLQQATFAFQKKLKNSQ